MYKTKAKTERERICVEKVRMQLYVELLRQQMQLLNEGTPQNKIDKVLLLPQG